MLFLSIDDLVIVDLLDSNIFSYHKKSSFCCLRRLIIVSTSLQLTLFQTFKLISRETNNTLWLFKKKIPKILCGHKLWIYKVIYAHTLPVKRPITIKKCFTRAMYFYLQLGWCLRFEHLQNHNIEVLNHPPQIYTLTFNELSVLARISMELYNQRHKLLEETIHFFEMANCIGTVCELNNYTRCPPSTRKSNILLHKRRNWIFYFWCF